MDRTVLTIGHSNHSAAHFRELLAIHCIDIVCDVRSTPFSPYTPHFNRAELQHSLPEHGFRYLFLGAELGARSEDPSCYRDGKISYPLLSQTALFQSGLNRVEEGLRKNFRIALMCAEKEPIECHRFILISRSLTDRSINVRHIHGDGSIESHADALRRLSALVRVPEADLFRTAEQLEDEAYYRQERRIAYEPEPVVAAAG